MCGEGSERGKEREEGTGGRVGRQKVRKIR